MKYTKQQRADPRLRQAKLIPDQLLKLQYRTLVMGMIPLMFDTGFPCSSDNHAQILILGSMPSQKSLTALQYYAHPQNAFWPIMAELFCFDAGLQYVDRLQLLRENHVALWDVVHECIRPGSLDSAIDLKSVVANDFATFFSRHPAVRAIYFNGRKAEELYRRRVQAKLPLKFQQIKKHLLPSTSPANAGMSRLDKLKAWEIIRHTLENRQAHPYLSTSQ